MDSAANAVLSSPHFPSCEVDTTEKEVILGRVVPLAHGARSGLGLAWIHPPGKASHCAVLGNMLLGRNIIRHYLPITTYHWPRHKTNLQS